MCHLNTVSPVKQPETYSIYPHFVLLFCLLFIVFSNLFSDFEILDEDSIINIEEHFYEMQDDLELSTYTPSDKIRYSLQAYGRYQQTSDNLKNKNRLQIKNNTFDFRFIHEYNTVSGNSDLPIGASLKINTTRTDELMLGQYQIEQGYGLLFSRSSFISEKPGFNVDFSPSRGLVASNARPYFSRSFLGAAYKKTITDNFSLFIYGSHKDVGARVEDGRVTALDLDEPNPANTIVQSMGGTIIAYNKNTLNISGSVNYFHTEIPYMDEPVNASIGLSYGYTNYLFFLESAYINNSFAHLFGLKNSYQRFSQILSYRRIENGYSADYANFISNSSSQTNEEGIFYKIEYRTNDYLIQTFADVFRNLENHERYRDKNIGNNLGLNIERKIDDMSIGFSLRQKNDKEWRNLSGISSYENRKREYLKFTWQQVNTRFLTTRLRYDFQQREYVDYDIKDNGYALSQSINISSVEYRLNFSAGVFDTEIPLHLYLYSGRLNNPLIVLSGEGLYAMLNINKRVNNRLSLELMSYYINKAMPEYTLSGIIVYNW